MSEQIVYWVAFMKAATIQGLVEGPFTRHHKAHAELDKLAMLHPYDHFEVVQQRIEVEKLTW
jgi:hypothetical protein